MPKRVRGISLEWAGPEVPLPANSSMFLFITVGDDFTPEDVQCTVAGVPGTHVVLDGITYARPAFGSSQLTVLGGPAWDSPGGFPTPSFDRVLLWTPTRHLPVGQASVQFGTRREDGWWWRAARPSREPHGATTVVDVDHLAPEIPTVTLGHPTTKGEMRPLGRREATEGWETTGAALRIVAKEPLRWDLLRVTAAGGGLQPGSVRMGGYPRVNIRQRPYIAFVDVTGEVDRRKPLVVALENIVDLSGNRAPSASVTVFVPKPEPKAE